MLQSRSKLQTRDNGKRDRERDGDRCSVLVGDDILQLATPTAYPLPVVVLHFLTDATDYINSLWRTLFPSPVFVVLEQRR